MSMMGMAGLDFLFKFAPRQEWQMSPPNPALLVPPDCDTTAYACDGGRVETMTAYIFHPRAKMTVDDQLANQNVGDAMGDSLFICMDAVANHTQLDAYQWISQWELEVWTGFGSYQQCNGYGAGNICKANFGVQGQEWLVGKMAAAGLPPPAPKGGCTPKTCSVGRCDANPGVGSWYSLPASGQCASGQTPGPQSQCSWRAVRRVKTIDATCPLQTHGMLATCAPGKLAQSTQILTKAFASSSTSPLAGGCPAVA